MELLFAVIFWSFMFIGCKIHDYFSRKRWEKIERDLDLDKYNL